MKEYVSLTTFQNDLQDYYTYEACESLFNYFENLEEEIGYEINYDPIAIRCEWDEYESFKDVQENYEHLELITVDDLYKYTQVITFGDQSLLVQAF
jgi:hypothetical protein